MDTLTPPTRTETEQPPPEKITLKPGKRRDVVLQLIGNARERVLISLFRCDDLKVIYELANACQRGVRVRALVTPRAKGWKRKLKELRSFLEELGAEVLRYPSRALKYHAKYIVADDGPAVITSLNLTRKCFRQTCDFLLVTYDPEIVSGLQRLFEADCLASMTLPENLSDRLIVGPNQSRRRITQLLESAQRSIRIIDHRVVDAAMVALLKSKQAQGVSVEILGKGDVKGLASHGKMILVDGKVAVIGSLALSTPSLDFRREVAVTVHDPRCVEKLNKFFVEASEATVSVSPEGEAIS